MKINLKKAALFGILSASLFFGVNSYGGYNAKPNLIGQVSMLELVVSLLDWRDHGFLESSDSQTVMKTNHVVDIVLGDGYVVVESEPDPFAYVWVAPDECRSVSAVLDINGSGSISIGPVSLHLKGNSHTPITLATATTNQCMTTTFLTFAGNFPNAAGVYVNQFLR